MEGGDEGVDERKWASVGSERLPLSDRPKQLDAAEQDADPLKALSTKSHQGLRAPRRRRDLPVKLLDPVSTLF